MDNKFESIITESKLYKEKEIAKSIKKESRNISLIDKSGTPLSLSFLGSNIMDIEDAIEDASTAEEMANNLNNLNSLYLYKITPDRETSEYIRLKCVDDIGNVSYLKVLK